MPRRPPGADAMSVWLRPAQATRLPASAFSRDEITQAAIELADQGGLEAVSMRRIAARIGSAPTSLYWYFSDKDELYELMVDAVIGQVELPERPSGDWRADLRSIAVATRAAMSRHPWFAQLGIHPVAGPRTVRFGAVALRSLEGLGLDQETEVNILAAVNNYISGFVQREAAWRRFASPAAPAAARGHGEAAEMSAEHLEARTRLHGDESFAFGLDCLLDGFAVLIARTRLNGALPRGRGDGFDLHQLARVAEHGHAEQRARSVMITEGGFHDLPGRDEIGPPGRGHEHGGLEHIGESGAASGQGGTEIDHGHPGLRPDIVAADDAAAFVQRARAGGENQRARRGGRGIRIGNTRVQTVRTDQTDGHGRSLPAAPAGDFRARGPSYWDTSNTRRYG